jgi:hypothetical protein
MVVGFLNKLKKLATSLKSGGNVLAKIFSNDKVRRLASTVTKVITGFDPSEALDFGSEALNTSMGIINTVTEDDNYNDYNNQVGININRNSDERLSSHLDRATDLVSSFNNLRSSLSSSKNRILGSSNNKSLYNPLIQLQSENEDDY